MATTFSKTIITPSVQSTTMTGCKCSEIFLMNEDRTQSFTGVALSTITATFIPGIAEGPLVRINSEGWSTLLVWSIYDSTDRSNTTTPINSVVMGRRPAFNITATGEGDLDEEGNVYVLPKNTTTSGSTGAFRWEPCPLINSKQPVPGRDSDPPGDVPISPPMGCHVSGNVFTFAKGPRTNAGGNLQPDKAATEINFSSTNDTYLSGPAVIDVSSTTQIFHLPVVTPSTDEPGYFVGQFIS